MIAFIINEPKPLLRLTLHLLPMCIKCLTYSCWSFPPAVTYD